MIIVRFAGTSLHNNDDDDDDDTQICIRRRPDKIFSLRLPLWGEFLTFCEPRPTARAARYSAAPPNGRRARRAAQALGEPSGQLAAGTRSSGPPIKRIVFVQAAR